MDIRNNHHQTGLSLIEMMIAITLGLLILAGLMAVFISNSQARHEIERANRQIENGRYALQTLSDDIALAGYYAEFDPSGLSKPGSITDPCQTGLVALNDNIPLYVQGYDNVTSTVPSCLSDVKAGTDILVIRRVSTCNAGAGDCDPVAANQLPYFQASLCSPSPTQAPIELKFPITGPADYKGNYYQLDTNIANLTLHSRRTFAIPNCTTPCTASPNNCAPIHRYLTRIYFIANNNNPGDGIPTLKRAELSNGPAFTILPLVDGIENLQLEYGIDAPNIDGVPDSYNAAPATVNDWVSVVSIRVNLLARNTEASKGYVNKKTYTLGYDASGALITVPATNDSYKRHAFQSEIRLHNPAGRSSTCC